MGSDPTVGYAQAEPTEETALQSLQELVGTDNATAAWESACDRAQVVPPVWELPTLQLVAELLTASDVSLARVAGRSIVIRIASYRALNNEGLM
jgi:hypothetical protein